MSQIILDVNQTSERKIRKIITHFNFEMNVILSTPISLCLYLLSIKQHRGIPTVISYIEDMSVANDVRTGSMHV